MSDDMKQAGDNLATAQEQMAQAADDMMMDRNAGWDEYDAACSDFWDARLRADMYGL